MSFEDTCQVTKNGMFRKQYTDPVTKKRCSITAGSRVELMARLDDLARLARDVRYGAISASEAIRVRTNLTGEILTVAKVWEDYAKTQRRKAISAADYSVRIEPWLGSLIAVECNEQKIREWLLALEKQTYRKGGVERHYSEKTITGTFDRLAAAFSLAVRAGRLSELPFGKFRPKKAVVDDKPATESLEQLAAIVGAAQRHDGHKWKLGQFSDRSVAVLVMALTGLRQGEAAGLGWDDLNIDQAPALITVRHQALDSWRVEHPDWVRPLCPTKGRAVYTAILHEGAAAALRFQRDQLKRCGWYRPDGPVFPSAKSGDWRSHAMVVDPILIREFAKEAGAANWKKWVTHSLRHSFCSLEAAGGGALKDVQERARHASLEQTEHYIHKMGKGLPAPSIGLLPGMHGPCALSDACAAPALPVQSSRILPDGSIEVVTLAPLADLSQAMQAKWDEVQREKFRVLAARKARKADWARDHRDRPTPILDAAKKCPVGAVPAEIRDLADAAYQRAYHKAMRQGESGQAARERATRVRRTFVGSFRRLQSQQVLRNESEASL